MSNKPAGHGTVHTTGPKFTADTPFAAKATDAHPTTAEPAKAAPVATEANPAKAEAPAVDDKPAKADEKAADKPAEDAPAKESKPRKYIGKVGSLSEDVATFVTETQDRLAELVDRVQEINEKSAPEPGEERAATYLARVVMASEDLTRALAGVQATNNALSTAVTSV